MNRYYFTSPQLVIEAISKEEAIKKILDNVANGELILELDDVDENCIMS